MAVIQKRSSMFNKRRMIRSMLTIALLSGVPVVSCSDTPLTAPSNSGLLYYMDPRGWRITSYLMSLAPVFSTTAALPPTVVVTPVITGGDQGAPTEPIMDDPVTPSNVVQQMPRETENGGNGPSTLDQTAAAATIARTTSDITDGKNDVAVLSSAPVADMSVKGATSVDDFIVRANAAIKANDLAEMQEALDTCQQRLKEALPIREKAKLTDLLTTLTNIDGFSSQLKSANRASLSPSRLLPRMAVSSAAEDSSSASTTSRARTSSTVAADLAKGFDDRANAAIDSGLMDVVDGILGEIDGLLKLDSVTSPMQVIKLKEVQSSIRAKLDQMKVDQLKADGAVHGAQVTASINALPRGVHRLDMDFERYRQLLEEKRIANEQKTITTK